MQHFHLQDFAIIDIRLHNIVYKGDILGKYELLTYEIIDLGGMTKLFEKI